MIATKMTPEQVAAAFAALKNGRIAEYVGGGRIRVKNKFTSGSPCAYYVTTGEARKSIARAAA